MSYGKKLTVFAKTGIYVQINNAETEVCIIMADDNQLIISEKDIKKFLRQLKTEKIGYYDVPEEYRLHPDIVKGERKLGIRKSDKRGYDVIHNTFFVNEIVYIKNSYGETKEGYESNYFANFVSYYEFLNGDIYEKSCYYQYNFSQTEIDTYDIDMSKINNIALIDFTIKDFSVELSNEELQQYKEKEKDKALRKKWIAKFNVCNTYEEFNNTILKLMKSKFFNKYSDFYTRRSNLLFFVYNYIFSNIDRAFDIIMEYVSHGSVWYFLNGLCSIYDSEKVIASYNYSIGVRSTIYKHKKKLKNYIHSLNNGEVHFYQHCYFDEITHFFCCQVDGYIGNRNYISERNNYYSDAKVCRYFETFHEFVDYLNDDLSGCDLSKAILPDIDFSNYKMDEKTKLPLQNPDDLTYSLYKGYDREKDCFVVRQSWLNENGQTIREHINKFNYFFDFVFFLDNDLSDADLLLCNGLDNLYDISNLNLTNTKLKSNILDKLGEKYTLYTLDTTKIISFPPVLQNEEETELELISEREGSYSTEDFLKSLRVKYISDLHLMHRIQNAECKSEEDVIYTIQQIVDNLLYTYGGIILIGGDTSSDFNLFELFIKLLRKSIDENYEDYGNITVIFLLGNHELWEFPNDSFEEIVEKYSNVINKHNMYLLQNDIIYIDDYTGIQKIIADEILSSSKESLRAKLISAKLILFGGLAFSGYNKEFNANNGIYRLTINREQEITESKRFEKLYNNVKKILFDRRVIVFTHTPQKDWCSNNDPHSGFIYVSGHTHRNYFYDDGEYRIYADNQIGYKSKNAYPKYFYVEAEYDLFSEYDDGIYEITKEQYIDFYRGKKLSIQFSRDVYILYMLKKNGYYCFIHESPKGQLAIMNGGVLKNLNTNNISYYYDKMDEVVAYIKNPLDKFTSVQKKIANEIKAIGGSGTIHGAIIDIDFYNHIYVNPYDLTLTGYWAADMIDKKVFTSIPKLLETNCPSLYDNYLKHLNGKAETALTIICDKGQKKSARTHTYLSTDIYRASREIKKMQKLSSNILSKWYEPNKKMLE